MKADCNMSAAPPPPPPNYLHSNQSPRTSIYECNINFSQCAENITNVSSQTDAHFHLLFFDTPVLCENTKSISIWVLPVSTDAH